MRATREPALRRLDEGQEATLARHRRRVDPGRLRGLVGGLPAPRDRATDPAGMARLDRRLADASRRHGWAVGLRPFRAGPLAGVNVVAQRAPDAPGATVAVVAHHDTVAGTGGADDNGAGVVAVLELARLLAEVPLSRRVVLALVDLEEMGFHGARALVGDLKAAGAGVLGAFVLECVAYTDTGAGAQRIPAGFGMLYPGQVRRIRARGRVGDWEALVYRRDAEPLAVALAEGLVALRGPHGAVLVRDPSDLAGVGRVLRRVVPGLRHLYRSDHVAFWDAGVAAVQVTDTADLRNPHYHRRSDTPDTLDYDLLSDLVASLAAAVERLAGTPQRP